MIDDTVRNVLRHEGALAIVTGANGGPHLVGTWNSYVEILDENTLSIPAGGMQTTENNVRAGSPVQLLIASREVPGKDGYRGAGFRVVGRGEFQQGTAAHRRLQERFPWCRAALVVHVTAVERMI